MGSEERFYHLQDEGGPYDTSYLEAPPVKRGKAPRCPACDSVLGVLEWLPPYRVDVDIRGKGGAGDLAMLRDLLISERFAQAFQAEGLTGLKGFDQVDVVKVKPRAAKERLPLYVRAQAVLGRAAIDESRSRLRHPHEVTCLECRSGGGVDAIYGFRIEPGTWTGEDVFRPRGLQSRIVVSERFAEFIKSHGFTNISLVPTEQYVHDPFRKGPPAAPATALKGPSN